MSKNLNLKVSIVWKISGVVLLDVVAEYRPIMFSVNKRRFFSKFIFWHDSWPARKLSILSGERKEPRQKVLPSGFATRRSPPPPALTLTSLCVALVRDFSRYPQVRAFSQATRQSLRTSSNKNVDFPDVRKWQAENFLSFNALTRQIRKVGVEKHRHSDLLC